MNARRSYSPSRSMASPIFVFVSSSETGTVSMDGRDTVSAPSSRSFSASLEARSLGLVTSIFSPNSGSCSYQPKVSASLQTSPTTMMAGVPMPCLPASSSSSPSAATTRRCPAEVPRSSTAAGISAGIPAARSPLTISGRLRTPMRNTRVPPHATKDLKSISRVSPAFLCPVMMWTEEANSLWVTGIPL